MNDEIISDLKQFFSATMHQELSGIKDDLSGVKDDLMSLKNDMLVVRQDLKVLTNRVDDIDAKLDTVIEASGEELNNHDKRIIKLEAKAA